LGDKQKKLPIPGEGPVGGKRHIKIKSGGKSFGKTTDNGKGGKAHS